MGKYQFNEITLLQYVSILAGAQIGIGILSLPAETAKIVGTDGWISIILGWVLSVIAGLVIVHIMEKHPEDTIFELLQRYFGKWLGRTLCSAFVLYTLLAATTVLLTSIHLVQVWILPLTPNYLLMVLFIVPGFLAAWHGIRVIGRYSEIVFYSMLGIPLLLLVSVREGYFLHLLPLVKEGWIPILKAVKSTILSYLGFELAFLLYPFLKEKRKAKKGIIIANTISMFIFVFVTVICYLFYSPNEITKYIWPTLSLLKSLEFPFMERFEIVFLTYYLFVLSTTWIPYMFTAVFGTREILNRNNHVSILLIFVVAYTTVSFFYNPPLATLQKLSSWWGKTGLYTGYLFPVFLFIYVALFNWVQRGMKNEKN